MKPLKAQVMSCYMLCMASLQGRFVHGFLMSHLLSAGAAGSSVSARQTVQPVCRHYGQTCFVAVVLPLHSVSKFASGSCGRVLVL